MMGTILINKTLEYIIHAEKVGHLTSSRICSHFIVSRLQLLCLSCPSATKFSAILFLLFARSSSNSPRSFQRFRRTRRRIFNWIRHQMNNFPIDPRCENCQRAIFTMGVYGENSLPFVGFE